MFSAVANTYILAIVLFAFGAIPVHAGVHFIASNASGAATGNDWTNAWTDLPTTFIRGDVYYIATGIYGPHVFNTSVSGTKYIYIRKATSTDHGTDTGWSSVYGPGQAIFQSAAGILWDIRSGYWDFEGVSGSGTTGHGIKLYSSSLSESEPCVYITYGSSASFLNFKHVEFQGPPHGGSNPTRMFFCNATNSNNLTFQYCFFHETGKSWMTLNQNNKDVLIEHSYFKNAGSGDASMHSAGMCIFASTAINLTIRYNVFENMMFTSNTTYIELQGKGGSGFAIYGNVFRATSPQEFVSAGIFSYTSTDYGSGIRIYNNTVYGLHSYNPGIHITSGCTDVIVVNNIWQGCSTIPAFQTGIYENSNIKNTGEVKFLDPVAGDFHLAASTAAGAILAPPYHIDPNGIQRGGDGNWDRGAFEIGVAIAAPEAPKGLRISP